MKKDRSTLTRGVFMLAALFTLWLGVVGYARIIAPGKGVDLSPKTVELSHEEIRRLSQLHGTNVIKVERDTISILRDGRWIPVSRGDRG